MRSRASLRDGSIHQENHGAFRRNAVSHSHLLSIYLSARLLHGISGSLINSLRLDDRQGKAVLTAIGEWVAEKPGGASEIRTVVTLSGLPDSLIKFSLFAMRMPCRFSYSAWHLFRRSNCADVYWTTGAPEEIRTPDPQIRSLVFYPAELKAWRAAPKNRRTGRFS